MSLCKNCKNFIQHYNCVRGLPDEVGCGHCTLMKNVNILGKNIEDCKHFEEKVKIKLWI